MNIPVKEPIMEGENNLIVTEYHDSSAFDVLANQWDKLLTCCSTNTPFLTWQWQKLWWNSWHHNRHLRIITVSEESGKLCGLAPLYAEEKEDKQVLMLLGSADVCDYLDCIILQGEEERFYRTLLSHLVSSSRKPVTLHLNSLQQHSPAISFFAAVSHREGYPVEVNREDTAPALDLPFTVESYLNTLTKKNRHEVRRKKRRAEKEGTVTFHKIVHPSQVMEIFPRFITLFRKTARNKDAFLTPEREQFFLSVAEEFSRREWLELFVLSFDKKEVAYLLSFHYNDTLYLYNAAYDPGYSSLSPGIVAITYCLEDTISRGIQRFDFLRGDETYKYRFGAHDNHLYRLTVTLLGEKKTCIA
jgi:CelD/BcsL family acetyltransferase involved in cellulose biosynthesis